MKKILTLLLTVSFLYSCTNKLELQPEQSIDSTVALEVDQDIESALMGCYALLGGAAFYGSSLLLVGDLLAADGNLSWRGTFQGPRQVATRSMNALNTEAERIWLRGYRTINMANTILENLSKVKNESLRNRIEGEALTIRALVHFELVRLYAKPWVIGQTNSQLGVPVLTKSSNTEALASQMPARSPISDVYAQIIADLTKAETLLPKKNGTRLGADAVNAILSRVYLMRGEYSKAAVAADKVIASGNYTLSAALAAPYGNRSNSAFQGENIFEIMQNNQNNAGTVNDGLATFYASLVGIGRGDIQVLAALRGQYPAGDQRLAQLFYVGVGRRPGATYTGKWTDFFANIPIIRLSEMFLTRAECNLRENTSVGAAPLADLNRIRNRAGLPNLTTATLDDVLKERYLELIFEGHRIHDIRRTQGRTGSFNYDSPKLVMPIPQREIIANPKLVQNEGY